MTRYLGWIRPQQISDRSEARGLSPQSRDRIHDRFFIGRYIQGKLIAYFRSCPWKVSIARSHINHRSNGRVEDGRGGLGPMANTPFPVPAHRTGRADFRHPALRPVSSRGIRRGNPGQAFETQQAAFSMDNFKREPPCATPCHLVPSGKEVSYALIDIVVDSPVGRTPRSEAEVV